MTLLRFFWNQPVTVPPPGGGWTRGGGPFLSLSIFWPCFRRSRSCLTVFCVRLPPCPVHQHPPGHPYDTRTLQCHCPVVIRYELDNALQSYGLYFKAPEMDQIMDYFDTDGSGQITVNEFLRGIRGTMNDSRKRLVSQAYGLLDANGVSAPCACVYGFGKGLLMHGLVKTCAREQGARKWTIWGSVQHSTVFWNPKMCSNANQSQCRSTDRAKVTATKEMHWFLFQSHAMPCHAISVAMRGMLHFTIRCGTIRYGTVRYNTIRCDDIRSIR